MDETYERALRAINEKEREYAYRIFQFLTVSARRLRVEELVEIFAIEVGAESSVIPEFNAHWRSKDAEEAVLLTCSNLVAVVEDHGERTAQFSHPSVQQFLTSDCIANYKDVSDFQVLLEPAHTFVARACLSLLLDEHNETGTIHDSPLHSYAAEYWVYHARFGNVQSSIREGMERLFDKKGPHFTAWIGAYDLDGLKKSSPMPLAYPAPLYYAALCGFCDLTKHLLATHPQDVNARGGFRETPLHAALDNGHVDVARLLLQHGADVDVLDSHNQTPLHLAAKCGDLEGLRFLIERGLKPNAQNKDQETPLFLASRNGKLDATRFLCEHGGDITHQNSLGRTPLHVAAEKDHYDISCLLLDLGADGNAQEKNQRTPLHLAAEQGKLAVAELLLEHCAKVDSRDNMGWSPLHFASKQGHLEFVRLLLKHDAHALARNEEDQTFLDVAQQYQHKEIIKSRYNDGQTALHIASAASHHKDLELMHWLIDERYITPNEEDDDKETPLFPASRNGNLEATRLLLESNAEPNHLDWQEMTPLHVASENGRDKVTELLLENKAHVNASHVYGWTPLHLASRRGHHSVAKVLLDGHAGEIANVHAKNDAAWTPLHMASEKGHLKVVELLLACGAKVDAQNADKETALHLAAFYGHLDVVQALLKEGPLVLKNQKGETPWDLASKEGDDSIMEVLGTHLKSMALAREGPEGEEVGQLVRVAS